MFTDPNDVLARWLLMWVEDPNAETELALVHRLWMLDHMDAGLYLKLSERQKGAKYLKDFKGATFGRTAKVSVLRGVRPSDDREDITAIHALTTGLLVPLQEAMQAWASAPDRLLPSIPRAWSEQQTEWGKRAKARVDAMDLDPVEHAENTHKWVDAG